MKMNFAKLLLLCLPLTICLDTPIAASGPDGAVQISEQPETVRAKREIIRLLLTEAFRGEESEEICLLTKNIPSELIENFPVFENLTVRFISEAEAEALQVCPFEIERFLLSEKRATVMFGDCGQGLGYEFEKVRGKWQFAPLDIVR